MKIIVVVAFTLITQILYSQVIIIPDIHGRDFWKEIVENNKDKKIIFLGDYLDPYRHECISEDIALQNFDEIIEFKKSNMDRVTLLLGNHDIHYVDNDFQFSRKDTLRANLLNEIFMDNKDLFEVAHSMKIDGRYFLFTHAGILKSWWNRYYDATDDVEKIVSALNQAWVGEKVIDFIDYPLMDIAAARGGDAESGSCMWADVDEFEDQDPYPANCYQVFGHTQQEEDAIIKDWYADLDCRKAFSIDSEGKIQCMSFK